MQNIRAGYGSNAFIYDPRDPGAVKSDLNQKGERGFIYRIINAHGNYNTLDPLDGKREMANFPTWPTIHWEDWKPVAGENAWVAMAALHIYYRKYFDQYRREFFHNFDAEELKLAEELARAALLLQSETGGIRMAPIGTFREGEISPRQDWWYNQISTENNLSWYGAFQMLHEITGKKEYRWALEDLEAFFMKVWNKEGQYFYQGMTFKDDQWQVNQKDFALDVQTWGILALGAAQLDEWFGYGAAYQMWMNGKKHSGAYDENGTFWGVGFSDEHNRVSVEWTSGAIMATRHLAELYRGKEPQWVFDCQNDASLMRKGIEKLKVQTAQGAAYSYSSRRDWIPFGWNSHDPRVLSLASTGWVIFSDQEFNPFRLPHHQSLKMAFSR